MAKVTKLTETLHARGIVDGPSLDNEFDRSSRQSHSGHLKARGGANNPILLQKGDLQEKRVEKRRCQYDLYLEVKENNPENETRRRS